jgi:UDP-glucose 4-epimerase
VADTQIPKVIAVTGSSGYIGEYFVERLLASDAVERVVGIDREPSALKHEKFTSVQQDITEPLDVLFQENGVGAVVHLAFLLRQLRSKKESVRVNVGGASNVLWACEAAGVKRIVLLSSSTVYGAHADNPDEITEAAPVNPPKGFNYAVEKSTVETYFRRYLEQREGLELSILRSCVVMGPNANNFITEALNKPLLIGVGNADPPMQFLHEEDLLNVLWRFVSEAHSGIYNVAGRGTVRWSELVKMAHKRLLRLSPKVAYGLTNLTWAMHIQNDAPGVGLDFIRWPWVVKTDKLEQELGSPLKRSSRQALESRFAAPSTPAAPPST